MVAYQNPGYAVRFTPDLASAGSIYTIPFDDVCIKVEVSVAALK